MSEAVKLDLNDTAKVTNMVNALAHITYLVNAHEHCAALPIQCGINGSCLIVASLLTDCDGYIITYIDLNDPYENYEYVREYGSLQDVKDAFKISMEV